MLILAIIIFSVQGIPLIMLFASVIISKKAVFNQEKKTPFECGYDPLSPNRHPFSVQFFLVSIIFLIFDIEIIMLIPMIKLTMKFSPLSIIMVLTFLMILILGLYFEYIEKSIEWKI